MPEIRVLIAADNLLARVGLAALLAAQPDVAVVGQTPGGDTLINDLDVYRPDVVIYDLGYEPLALLACLTALVETRAAVVALLPDSETAPGIAAALGEARAFGLLLRDSGAVLMASAAAAVASGLVALDPALASAFVPRGDTSELPIPADQLTPREFEVLHLMAQGLPNKAIAQALGISPNTVKFHINAILSKLGVQSRTEAVVRATRLGLIIL